VPGVTGDLIVGKLDLFEPAGVYNALGH
jgi:hypothetical protein